MWFKWKRNFYKSIQVVILIILMNINHIFTLLHNKLMWLSLLDTPAQV